MTNNNNKRAAIPSSRASVAPPLPPSHIHGGIQKPSEAQRAWLSIDLPLEVGSLLQQVAQEQAPNKDALCREILASITKTTGKLNWVCHIDSPGKWIRAKYIRTYESSAAATAAAAAAAAPSSAMQINEMQEERQQQDFSSMSEETSPLAAAAAPRGSFSSIGSQSSVSTIGYEGPGLDPFSCSPGNDFGGEEHDAATVISILRELPNMELDDGQKYMPSVAFPTDDKLSEVQEGGGRAVNKAKVLVPGADLPARPQRLCRIANCKNRYRSPGYLCEGHGGGRCQAQGCTKLHQGRKGLPDFFFCRFHRKRYGELTAQFDAL